MEIQSILNFTSMKIPVSVITNYKQYYYNENQMNYNEDEDVEIDRNYDQIVKLMYKINLTAKNRFKKIQKSVKSG